MLNREHHVVVFHDETKAAGPDKYHGHVLLFVPQKLIVKDSDSFFNEDKFLSEPLKRLYEKILEVKRLFGQEKHKLHFSSGVSGKRWSTMLDCYRKVSEIVVDALRHKGSQEFEKPICCKMAVMFYPKDTNLSMYGGSEKKEKKLRHEETILRILLKGAVHFLYGEATPVVINKVVTDGYPAHRKLSKDRVILPLLYDELNLRTSLRNHVTFTDETEIIALNSDHKHYDLNSTEYIYANLLQVTDLLLGSTIESCLKGVQDWSICPKVGQKELPVKQIVAYPIAEMLSKEIRGYGFRNSGHYKSFVVSLVRFHNDGVGFRDLKVQSIKHKSVQIDIPI